MFHSKLYGARAQADSGGHFIPLREGLGLLDHARHVKTVASPLLETYVYKMVE